jgi:hypothetical protein
MRLFSVHSLSSMGFFSIHVDIHFLRLDDIPLNDIIGRVIVVDRVISISVFGIVDEVNFICVFCEGSFRIFTFVQLAEGRPV